MAPDLASLPGSTGLSVDEKVDAALRLEPGANLVFVHRDSDQRDPRPRIGEIARSFQGRQVRHVPIVPVQATEAWLFLDERAIRFAASNPGGRERLSLPKPSRIEGLAGPKERLLETLVTASELSGRRLKKLRRQFPRLRASLLRMIDIDGSIRSLPSWQRLVRDIDETVVELIARQRA